ncbi:hypothetical protein CEN44_23230 [Fischerella muscicola CCMEE 5323]|uniref:Uncharacterized protein n=1 Tax=Fischerella muscicola CCMEE 5323 TaxID=2019572 RepID=A0A2N6JXF8_FISMU|nr:hypothetical protein CEN44_23230 [Fischerella muscicola CCMEE 5323]
MLGTLGAFERAIAFLVTAIRAIALSFVAAITLQLFHIITDIAYNCKLFRIFLDVFSILANLRAYYRMRK